VNSPKPHDRKLKGFQCPRIGGDSTGIVDHDHWLRQLRSDCTIQVAAEPCFGPARLYRHRWRSADGTLDILRDYQHEITRVNLEPVGGIPM
jgi:hypothetical protein